MKKRKMVLGLVTFLITIMLCGCGEQLYELTEEETNSIAAYAAHVISKHNINQSKGVVKLSDSRQEVQEETPDTESAEEESTGNQALPEGEEVSESVTSTLVSLQEALAIEDINVSFQNYEVREDYIEGDYYDIEAPSGSKVLILHFTLTNAGETDVACDILSRTIDFQVTVNDTYSKKSDVTILLDDLSTYQGTIAAGTSQEAVLLFTMPSEELEAVGQLQLKVTEGDTASTVQLK